MAWVIKGDRLYDAVSKAFIPIVGQLAIDPATGSPISNAPVRLIGAAKLPSALATVNATLVRAGYVGLMSVTAYNASAAVKFLKLYDKATAPVVGTDVPLFTFAIPAAGQLHLSWPNLFKFTNGLGFGLTGAAPDNDTTALALADVLGLNLAYEY